MRTLRKVLFWWLVVGFVVTNVRACIISEAAGQQGVSEQKDEVFQKLLLSYPPRTHEQGDCIKRLQDSNVFWELDAEQRVIGECKLQKATPAEQARLKEAIERYNQIMSLENNQEKFDQLSFFYKTHPNARVDYENFCSEVANTKSSYCGYYRYVVQMQNQK